MTEDYLSLLQELFSNIKRVAVLPSSHSFLIFFLAVFIELAIFISVGFLVEVECGRRTVGVVVWWDLALLVNLVQASLLLERRK